MPRANRERIVSEARRIARRTKGPLTLHRFTRAARISLSQVYYWFPEGWPDVLKRAGLGHRAALRRETTPEMLLADIDRVARRLGKPPSWSQYERLRSRDYAVTDYRRHFGRGSAPIRRYLQWKGERAPGAVHPLGRPPRRGTRSPVAGREHAALLRKLPRRKHLGRPFDFRGMLHEPVNEAGVVHAAGVLWQEAGLIMVRMGTAYPDCDALIRVPGRPDAWQRVRVEFEFRSSEFRAHRHDPAGCDLIVCWEHDWPECPVEVLELRPLALPTGAAPRRGFSTAA